MLLGEILFRAKMLAMESVLQMDLPTDDTEYVYNMNALMDREINHAVKNITRKLKTLFTEIDDKEALNTALYITYFELRKKNNPIINEWLDKLGSVDRFMSYYRRTNSNPF